MIDWYMEDNMNLFGWLNSFFNDTDSASSSLCAWDSSCASVDDDVSNPANGLPMIGGFAGVDIEGNPYGTDFSHDSIASSYADDSCASDFGGDW